MKPKHQGDGADDRALFADLYKRFAADLPRWLRRFGVPGAEKQDVLQDALERIYVNASVIAKDKRDARLACFALVQAIAKALTRRTARRARWQEDTQIEACSPQDLESEVALYEALEQLDEDQRAAVIASDIYGQTNEEIAAAIGKSETYVKRLLDRGRRKLRAAMAAAVVVPLASLGLDPVQRAAFAALLRAEGRSPIFLLGGPGDPPPPASPPPPPPPPPAALGSSPIVIPSHLAAIVGAGLFAGIVAVVVALLLPPRDTPSRGDRAVSHAQAGISPSMLHMKIKWAGPGASTDQRHAEGNENAPRARAARTRVSLAPPQPMPTASSASSAVVPSSAPSSRPPISEEERRGALETIKGDGGGMFLHGVEP